MSTDRETTRLVRSWLEEGVTRLPDRVLDFVLDQVPATPQRRRWMPAWRFNEMNTFAKLIAAGAAVLVVAVIGYQLLPGGIGPGGPTTAPSPSPSPLARGSFVSHGVSAELDARGSGASVTGTMTLTDTDLHATVALECSRTAADGLIVIGGLVTSSTFDDNFPQGRRIAVIFQRGSPVKAVWYVALVSEALIPNCQALVENTVDTAAAAPGLEPIVGSIELAP